MHFKTRYIEYIMSGAGTRNFPAFGITKSHKAAAGTSRTVVPIISIKDAEERPTTAGEIVMNDADSRLYYNIGDDWVQLSVQEKQSAKQPPSKTQPQQPQQSVQGSLQDRSGNITIAAPDGRSGKNVTISSGKGNFSNGEINFNVGGETALTLDKEGDLIVYKNLHFSGPESNVVYNICRDELAIDDSIPDAILTGPLGILTIYLDLEQNQSISGVLNNSLLKETSWINMTTVCNASCRVNVWLTDLADGSVTYNIRCEDGKLERLQLHVEIR